MTVSKRLRTEVFRRDGNTCQDCGRRPPEVVLEIDHLVPKTLGGRDEPGNLQALCRDCNSGKGSMPSDAPVVAKVAEKAAEWAAAMLQAAGELKLHDNTAVYDGVWNAWTSYRRQREIPADWKQTIDQYLNAGLPGEDIIEMARVADAKPDVMQRWPYFCGCCRTRLENIQRRAAEITSGGIVTPVTLSDSDLVATRVTRGQIKNSLRWLTERLVEEFRISEAEAIDVSDGYCVHDEKVEECGELVCVYIFLAERFMELHATDEAHRDAHEHPKTSAGWFKWVWYGLAWNLGRRAWKDVHPEDLDEFKAIAAEAELTSKDKGFVNADGKIYYTHAPRPLEFFSDVDRFLAKGLGRSQIERNVVEAMSAPIDSVDMWSYFRGCCRRDLALAGGVSD